MKTYGLIGHPLGHSFSKRFFTDKFSKETKQEVYLNFDIDRIELLPEIINANPTLTGLNVTIPFKQKAITCLTLADEVALAVGAVNTIKIIRENNRLELHGFNTDVHGFTESLRPLLMPWHIKALILGTGGAARAVRFALEKMHIEWLQVSRSPGGENCILYSKIDKVLINNYLLIINTTPLGTFPNIDTFPEIPYQYLGSNHLLFDLVYNPAETRFLQMGKAFGSVTKNGYEMLELQALKSYEIWNSPLF